MHKIMSSISLLTSTLYFFGLDKLYSFPKKIKICHNVVSVCVAFGLTGVVMEDNITQTFEIILWNFVYCVQYVIAVVYNIYFEEARLRRVFKNLNKVDKNLSTGDETTTIGFRISGLTTLVVGIKLLMSFALINGRDEKSSSVSIILVSVIPILAVELGEIWWIFLVLLVRYRLQYIWKHLKGIYQKEWYKAEKVSVLLPSVNTQGKAKDEEVLKLLQAYQALVETAEDITRSIQLNFTTRLCASIINLFILIYRFMSDSTNVGNLVTVVSSFILGLALAFILTLWPCVIAECCERKTSEIKTIVVQQMLRTDISETARTVLHRFIRLINICPICFKLYGVYKIDASLIVNSFNVCVTYTIFLLQSMMYAKK